MRAATHKGCITQSKSRQALLKFVVKWKTDRFARSVYRRDDACVRLVHKLLLRGVEADQSTLKEDDRVFFFRIR